MKLLYIMALSMVCIVSGYAQDYVEYLPEQLIIPTMTNCVTWRKTNEYEGKYYISATNVITDVLLSSTNDLSSLYQPDIIILDANIYEGYMIYIEKDGDVIRTYVLTNGVLQERSE